MGIGIPRPTREYRAYARIACGVLSILLLWILFSIPSTSSLITSVSERAGLQGSLPLLLFRLVLLLVLYEILIRTLMYFWLRTDRDPGYGAVISDGDLRINKTRGISGIPLFREEFDGIVRSSEKGVVDIVNTILSIAFSLEASDIHISPGPETALVGMRIHGNIYPLGEIDMDLYQHLVRRIKVLSGLSSFRQGIPQDGRLNISNKAYSARVSVFPTVNGEKIAMRLAGGGARIMELDGTGMPGAMLLDYKALLNRNQGMIVITGPTGSGKTTTMLSSLLYIRQQRRHSVNIVTLEDPIETRFNGIQQTQVEQGTGLTFSAGLRSVLRQDPDVIMLGEIRDEETASIATRASMTGHLLLTTVHANSTSGVFNRLSQMGVDPVQLSSTVHAVVSQRLCRRLCPDCRKEAAVNESHVRQLKLLGVDKVPDGVFYESEGCEECLGHGFIGRVAIFEMLLVTDDLRDLISGGIPAHVLGREARRLGMPTLLDHGLELARQGRISLMELTRVVSD